MIDPRTTLVLIRESTTDVWKAKTQQVRAVAFDTARSRMVVTYNGGKAYPYSPDRVRVLRDPVSIPVPRGARLRIHGKLWSRRELEVQEFGQAPDAWRVVSWHSKGEEQFVPYPASVVRVVASAASSGRPEAVMEYWRAIVASRGADDPLAVSYRSMDFIDPESVLARYLNGDVPGHVTAPESVVFPFACNLSQYDAVQVGLTSALSVIEGPPGTGKTQTILNLVANIVTSDLGTVGVVSLGNSAVENVGEKLEEEGFGHIVAQLGSKEKTEAFVARHTARDAAAAAFADEQSEDVPTTAQVAGACERLMSVLGAGRRRAELRASIDAYELERDHFERHRSDEGTVELEDLPLLRRSPARIIEFLAETQIDDEAGRPGLVGRIRRYFRFGSTRGLDTDDTGVVLALQAAFYERRIAELERELEDVERLLEAEDADGLAALHQELSLTAFGAAVAARHAHAPEPMPDGKVPRDRDGFTTFCTAHPVLLSTCHSLRRHLPDGYLLDYLIVDEASQVDLLTASLAMASCRNLIVVGDRRQLPHIAGRPVAGLASPAPVYDCQEHSVLSSVTELYGDELPTTLLREHYRCHPAIIGFCNAAFYEDQLIPYTLAEGRTEPAMWVHATAEGNHMRLHHQGGRFNQRELDVIEQEVLLHAPIGIESRDVAVATPFRRQADRAASSLADVAELSDTVHRLQGREKRMVILSTVLSENAAGRSGLRFVDDPHLVNVAVSRAREHFVLVTNHGKLAGSRHLRDLVGYIEHRYPDQQPEASRVVSVFDLLYSEYDDALRSLAARSRDRPGSPAERIFDAVLADLLAEPGHTHLRYESQILLRNLVPDPEVLDVAERAFVGRRSSVDFVVYNRITRRPALAIEVDGYAFHENQPAQRRRDALKDSVLASVGVPLLRLPTTGSGEEEQVRAALAESEGIRADRRG
jgi:hypothetical protein